MTTLCSITSAAFFKHFGLPIDADKLVGQTFNVNDSEEETYCGVNLYDDEDAFIHDNELKFSKDENGDLQLIWQGNIDDFYTFPTNNCL
jgi:hypothetical protein